MKLNDFYIFDERILKYYTVVILTDMLINFFFKHSET